MQRHRRRGGGSRSNAGEKPQPALWTESERPPRASEPRESAAAPQAPPRFPPVNRQQMMWRAVDVERWVEPDHLVRAIWEMSGRLDLTPYTVVVRAVEGEAGRPPIDPRLLIGLWIYAYSEKVSSAREVDAALRLPSGLSVADGVRDH